MTFLLSFRNVSFGYGKGELIRDISFELMPGCCTALIGPNGAGKTTILRLAAGILKSREGTVLLRDQRVDQLPLREAARTLALVPQHLEIPFAFTVRQVVEQGRTPYRTLLRGEVPHDHWAVDRALDLTDLTGLQHRIFNELSGGERQRVKIALGLAQEPKLLLLDEPAQNLDIGRQVELIDLLRFLRDEGITILASIHELHLIKDNFSSVLLLSPDNGMLHGTSEEILRPALLENAFDCPPGRHPLLVTPTHHGIETE